MIKRDKSHYEAITDQGTWFTWRVHFESTVATHDCLDILNAAYVPPPGPLTDLFNVKKVFMWAVLTDKIQFDQGKALNRRHIATRDPQALWRDILAYFQDSPISRPRKNV